MFEDTYKTIAGPSEGIYREKGSKFIALAFPVETEAEIKEKLAEIQKQYFDARHHCYSYILGPNKDAYRLNDYHDFNDLTDLCSDRQPNHLRKRVALHLERYHLH